MGCEHEKTAAEKGCTSMHSCRRLREIEGVDGFHEMQGPLSSPIEESDRPARELRPSTDAASVVRDILSMPDDHSKSEGGASSSENMLSMKEVATQVGMTPPLSKSNRDQLVRDMKLSDWTHLLSSSRPKSFRKAISKLVLTQNDLCKDIGEGTLWFPPLLDSNARMDFLEELE